jgi:hypothetical protein
LGGDVAKKIADEQFVSYELVQIIARALAAAQPVQGEPEATEGAQGEASVAEVTWFDPALDVLSRDTGPARKVVDYAQAVIDELPLGTLLYTAPQARKRVTEAEIAQVMARVHGGAFREYDASDLREGVRAALAYVGVELEGGGA